MKNIDMFWSDPIIRPGNFGDMLSPSILRECGYTANRVDKNSSNKLNCIGSTARFIRKGDIVWGTGIMNKSDKIERDAKYLAVRGPLTGEKVNCDIYGDPGLLCSHLWPMNSDKSHKLGFTPHYVDYDIFDINKNDEIYLRTRNPIEIIKKIVKYESIISSSLHGIIIAHSYNIPAGWWQPSERLSGDGSKFQDYALSVGIDLKPEKDWKKVKLTLPSKDIINKIQKNLLDSVKKI